MCVIGYYWEMQFLYTGCCNNCSANLLCRLRCICFAQIITSICVYVRPLPKQRRCRGSLLSTWNLPPQSGHCAGGWVVANHFCRNAFVLWDHCHTAATAWVWLTVVLLVQMFDSLQPLPMSYSVLLDILWWSLVTLWLMGWGGGGWIITFEILMITSAEGYLRDI